MLLPIVVSNYVTSESFTRHDLQANAGELVTSVCMAMKDKMELTIGVCVGSSIVRSSHFLFLLVLC